MFCLIYQIDEEVNRMQNNIIPTVGVIQTPDENDLPRPKINEIGISHLAESQDAKNLVKEEHEKLFDFASSSWLPIAQSNVERLKDILNISKNEHKSIKSELDVRLHPKLTH